MKQPEQNIFLLKVLLLLLIVCLASPLQSQDKRSGRTVVAFVSDTQEPMWIEKLWLKDDNNEEATSAIFSALLKETEASALFHLGDITSMGAFQFEWNKMDKYLSDLQKRGIPVYPAMGNHEYFIFSSWGKSMFFKKFPQIHSSWYFKRFGNIAVILLNSNFSNLSEKEISEQQKWFEDTVYKLDTDPQIKSVLVGTHYPPFTNSKVVSPSVEVQKSFVPVFLKSRKCRVFLSGHAHTFEHFQNGGKDFLVIGGGGGLQHPLLLGKDQRYRDLFPVQTEKRSFHYITCEEQNDSLNIKVKMISPDPKIFNQVYNIYINELK